MLSYHHRFKLGALELTALSSSRIVPTSPVLCLHGWLDNAASFIPLARVLPSQSLLALEFPGHGHSTHRGVDAHYYFFDWVQDLVRLCRQQQWQQLTMIGHSMGGMVATALAASFPELVKQLVLIDTLGFVVADETTAAKQLRLGVESRLRADSRASPRYPNLQAAAEARLRQSDFSLQEAMLLAERGCIEEAEGWRWRADMRLKQQSVYRLSPAQANTFIAELRCPVLAILAEDGIFNEQAARLLPLYPDIQVQSVRGGHHCHMTRSKEVASHIEHFLSVAT